MAADGDGELACTPRRPPVSFLQPLSQQQLPRQSVRSQPPVGPHGLTGSHLQAVITHRVGQFVYLAGERGRGFTDVVHAGQPHDQRPPV